MKKFLEWLVKKAETTLVGKCLTIAALLFLVTFLISQAFKEPRLIRFYGVIMLLAIGLGILTVVLWILYLFFNRKRLKKN